MKFRNWIFALIALSFIFSLFADETPKTTLVTGISNYGSETLDSLEGTGLIKLNGTSITRSVQLTGSLITNNAQVGTIHIIGEANLTGTTVQNDASVAGSLQATRSVFKKALSLHSQKAVFTASKLEGITIHKDAALKNKQVIELKQGTIVNGAVHFESGKGEIIVHPGCQVLGPVTGGKIVKKSST